MPLRRLPEALLMLTLRHVVRTPSGWSAPELYRATDNTDVTPHAAEF
jgi:hypothetical protein